MASLSPKQQCAAENASGRRLQQCKNQAMKGSDLCGRHAALAGKGYMIPRWRASQARGEDK